MRYVWIGLGCYLCHLVQTAVFPAVFDGSFGLLTLAAAVLAGLYAGPWAGGIAGFLLGLAAEATSAYPALTFLLPFCLAGLAAGFFAKSPAWRQVLAGGVAVILAVVACHLRLGWSVALAGGDFSLGRALLAAVLPDTGWTLGYFLVVFGGRLGVQQLATWRRVRSSLPQ